MLGWAHENCEGLILKQQSEVLKHREWRHLLREFVSAHGPMRRFPAGLLQFGLAPAAAAAWWLSSTQPHLLARDALHLVLPGASTFEAVDGGRWFAFLPWLLGRPNMRITVTLVGDEVRKERHPHPGDLTGLRRQGTPAQVALAGHPPAAVFEGTLAEWLAGPGAGGEVDACVLFSPGFGQHYKSWFGEEGVLALMRKKVPVAHFGYSKFDSLEDLEVLRLLEIEIAPGPLRLCPWHLENEFTAAIGGYAQLQQDLNLISAPERPDVENEALREFDELQNYARHDYENFGADQALERLGRRMPVRNAKTGADDAIILLPHEHGIVESTRQLGYFDEEGFSPIQPDIVVPEEHLASRPEDDRLVARYLWALKLHRDWVAPTLAAAESGMFGEDGAADGMRALLRQLTGEDVDPSDFMEQMRAAGGVHGPTYPSWWDMLEETLGWDLQDYNEECDRLEVAFWAPAPVHDAYLPVVCEAYAYFPDDSGDTLAQEAMQVVAGDYPEGALLLFKAMPYTEVAGHKYNFGGMLFWKGKWSPFAMNEHQTSADDVITQVESGFTFETGNPAYADDDSRLAVPFNRMCYGQDPNAPGKIVGMRMGKWTTLMPS